MWMRGGTSKGAYFLAEDLPADVAERDDLLLRLLGSPDPRQIDGIGGAHPLTSKVAIVSRSARDDADVEYLFLQVMPDRPVVTDKQNCGNLLAGVGPFALERGLVDAGGDKTDVRIYQRNDDTVATASLRTPGGRSSYQGDTAIAGVPGTSAMILLSFVGTAGSTCGALVPTGNRLDTIDGLHITAIDNGMPTVVLRADELGIEGDEAPDVLEANAGLRARLEALRLKIGPAMGLGDVTDLTVPKLTIVSPPRAGGALCTRTFIPHRCHDAIGVLGAVSVATAALLEGTVAHQLAVLPPPGQPVALEHPTGDFAVVVDLEGETVRSAGVVRTARKLFDGLVFPR